MVYAFQSSDTCTFLVNLWRLLSKYRQSGRLVDREIRPREQQQQEAFTGQKQQPQTQQKYDLFMGQLQQYAAVMLHTQQSAQIAQPSTISSTAIFLIHEVTKIK
jgi:hypothetical protein